MREYGIPLVSSEFVCSTKHAWPLWCSAWIAQIGRVATGLLLLGVVERGIAGEVSTWPQWRGPDRDGIVRGRTWPDRIDSAHLKLRWRVELEPSYSGPILTEDRVFTTETRNKSTEVVSAWDRVSGEKLWEKSWEGALSVPFFARANGDWIRSTPAWDGRHLYVAGMRDVLVCLDGQNGNVIWRRDFPKEEGSTLPTFGFVSSPLIDGEFLYTQAAEAVLCLNRSTGEIVWRQMRDGGGMNGSAFSSPYIATLAGKRQLLVQTRTTLAGLDPESGKVLWSEDIPAFRGMNILTPVTQGNRVFTGAYGGRSHAWDIVADGDGYRVQKAWEYKAQGYMTTPVLVEGRLYYLLRNQRFLCLDWASGREMWTSSKSFGKYLSLIAQNDRILALDERGLLFLIEANGRDLKILDERRVGSDTWAHVAVSGSQVCIRELKALALYDWASPTQASNEDSLKP